MIENIKTGLIIVLALGCWYINDSFNDYKDNINDQISKNVAEKQRKEAEQNRRYNELESSYVDARSRLRAALERLRNTPAVPWGEGLPVAECGSNAMPRTPENTTGTDEEIEITDRIRQTDFFRAAMNDALQCSMLIDFISKQGGKHY